MTQKERYRQVLKWFEANNPLPETELDYADPYELFVAVILSAQCTDARVNMITPAFFKKFPDYKHLSAASQEEVFELIRSCSYPNSKARHLIGMAQVLKNEFNGKVPDDIEQLQRLPGVGRKTANVVASVIFRKPAMAVDTHVFRVAARIGLTLHARTPLKAEKQLVRHIPESKIHMAHHWLILHGRYICQARKPKCDQCGISGLCKYFQQNNGPGFDQAVR